MKKILLVIVVLIAGLWLTKNLLAKAAVTNVVHAITGLRLEIKEMKIGVVNTRIGIVGLRVMNPEGFEDPVMIDVPEIDVDYDLAAFFKGAAHLELMRLNLAELTVVRNQQGQLNLNALNAIKASQGKPVPPKDQKTAKAMPFQIDLLDLNIGRVVYKDYSQGPSAKEQVFPININERFEHITDPYAFAGLIISRALTRTSIARLANFDLSSLQSLATSAAGDIVNSAVNRATKGLGQGASGAAGEAVKETSDALKKLLPGGNR